MVALYSFVPPQPAMVSVEFGTDTNYGLRTWKQNAFTYQGVQILVAGMRANTTYHLRADAELPDGTHSYDVDHTFTTGGLPAARIPQVTVSNPNGLTPTPGIVLFDLFPGSTNQVCCAAVDSAGNLIWYYDAGTSVADPQPIKLLPNGHLLLLFYGGTVREIDLAGNTISQFTSADVNHWLTAGGYTPVVDSSHDILPLPNGHLMLLADNSRNFTDLPGYPGVTSVAGNELIDLDENHNPVWVWDAFDHLDINRHPMNFPDWIHGNALAYSPDDGDLVFSMRHQSWVVKIDYANGLGSGQILWRLGYQGDFTLTNGEPADWFYAQHYANFVSANTMGIFDLMMFDNGNDRVVDNAGDLCGTAGQPPCYSRVPIFELNDVDKTATLLWQYNASPVYSLWGGSAQLLGNNNVTMGITMPSDNPTGTRYLELTHDPVPLIVSRMDVAGQNSYRSIHLPSLYPGVQW